MVLSGTALLSACSSDGAASSSARPGELAPGAVTYPPMGSLSADSGKGSFRFGAASAATQIEEQDTNTDWYIFTLPKSEGGLGNGKAPVGNASMGYSKAIEDIALMKAMHLDSYRFSIEWARVEPQRGVFDEAALQHYSDFIDALLAAGIKPIITVHHFSNPIWVDDPRDKDCANGPSDTNLCGLGHPVGGPLVVQEMTKFARLLAERFGDRVDEWGTVNEPVNYLVASYGIGYFPPGKQYIFDLLTKFVPVIEDYVDAHAAMYKAIHEADTIDADGDGVAASVGLTLSVGEWVPARFNAVSDLPQDVAARDRIEYVYHHLLVDSLLAGNFDANLDGTPDEDKPDWKGTLDWLGVQYYFRTGVTGNNGLIPVLMATPCSGTIDFGSCVPPVEPSHCVPAMRYEYYEQGIYDVLHDFGNRWPGLPLVVTEAGLATEVGARRAENVVRTLEQIERARREGVDVRGYYHWSLYDNFEWAEGFVPRFGLYRVDFDTYDRTPTEGATVLGDIVGGRTLTEALRQQYGGIGPMTPENPGVEPPERCNLAN